MLMVEGSGERGGKFFVCSLDRARLPLQLVTRRHVWMVHPSHLPAGPSSSEGATCSADSLQGVPSKSSQQKLFRIDEQKPRVVPTFQTLNRFSQSSFNELLQSCNPYSKDRPYPNHLDVQPKTYVQPGPSERCSCRFGV